MVWHATCLCEAPAKSSPFIATREELRMTTRLQDATAGRDQGRDPVLDLAGLVAQIRSAAMAATAIHLIQARATSDCSGGEWGSDCSPPAPKERRWGASDVFAREGIVEV